MGYDLPRLSTHWLIADTRSHDRYRFTRGREDIRTAFPLGSM